MKVTCPARRLAATTPLIMAFLAMPFLAFTGHAEEPGHDCDLKGLVLFSRFQYDYIGNLSEAGLLRANASGGHVVPLTPLISGDLYLDGRWSPDGQDIVYEYTTTAANLVTPSQLYVENREAGSVRQLTTGSGPKYGPAWSKSGWIAFLNGQDENGCLWAIRPNGTEQHLLFCPSLPYEALDTPQWSLDGKDIYLDVLWLPPIGLEPPEYSNLYKINVETGVATLILSYNTNDSLFAASLRVAPDGSRGVYVQNDVGTMNVVSYPAGNVIAQVSGTSPVWSKDSKHIVFSRNLSVPGTTRMFGALFVMDADGSHQRQLTPHRVANEFFTPADWSDDGMHIVINRAYNVSTVQIMDVNTLAITSVAQGVADYDSWKGSH